MRTTSSDENIILKPPRQMTLEQALEYIEEDELVEVTPTSIRLRKALLTENDRKRAGRAEGQGRSGRGVNRTHSPTQFQRHGHLRWPCLFYNGAKKERGPGIFRALAGCFRLRAVSACPLSALAKHLLNSLGHLGELLVGQRAVLQPARRPDRPAGWTAGWSASASGCGCPARALIGVEQLSTTPRFPSMPPLPPARPASRLPSRPSDAVARRTPGPGRRRSYRASLPGRAG